MLRRACAVAVIALLPLLWTAGPVLAEPAGSVVAVEGTVELGRGQDWTAAVLGAAVEVGDQVRTGNPGRVRVLFRDDSVLNLGDDSLLTVDESVFGGDAGARSIFTLLRGKVRAVVSEYYSDPLASAYEINTPTSVSGVRGTEYTVIYDLAREITEILCMSGLVGVKGVPARGDWVLLKPGQRTTVAKGGRPGPPAEWDPLGVVYGPMLRELDFIGGGQPEGLLDVDPVLGKGEVPARDRARPLDKPGNSDRGRRPLAERRPDQPHRSAADVLDQPPGLVGGNTELEIEF